MTLALLILMVIAFVCLLWYHLIAVESSQVLIDEYSQELKAMTRVIAKFKKPQIYYKGETMDGKYLILTVTRPALTAGDIATVNYTINQDGQELLAFAKPADIEAVDIKIIKGLVGLTVGVSFTDTSGNTSPATLSEEFDSIDTIAPDAPSGIALSLREANEADADDMPVVDPGNDENTEYTE